MVVVDNPTKWINADVLYHGEGSKKIVLKTYHHLVLHYPHALAINFNNGGSHLHWNPNPDNSTCRLYT